MAQNPLPLGMGSMSTTLSLCHARQLGRTAMALFLLLSSPTQSRTTSRRRSELSQSDGHQLTWGQFAGGQPAAHRSAWREFGRRTNQRSTINTSQILSRRNPARWHRSDRRTVNPLLNSPLLLRTYLYPFSMTWPATFLRASWYDSVGLTTADARCCQGRWYIVCLARAAGPCSSPCAPAEKYER